MWGVAGEAVARLGHALNDKQRILRLHLVDNRKALKTLSRGVT